MDELRPRDLIHVLTSRQRKRPLFIWGPPGVGKSDLVREAGERLGVPVWDVRLNLLDPTDLRGIPVPDMSEGTVKWFPPSFLPTKGPGILFFDEANSAPPLVMAAMYQLTLDGRIGEYILPDDVQIVLAGNRSGDRAVVHRMPTPLKSRFHHVEFGVNLDDWMVWAAAHEIRPEITAWVKFRYAAESANNRPHWPLFDFDPNSEDATFVCPRTLAMASEVLDMELRNPDTEIALLQGTIGGYSAADLVAYRNVFARVPDAGEILDGGKDIVPKELDILHALVMSLAYKSQPKHIDRIIQYSRKLAEEFAVLLVRSAGLKHGEHVRNSKEFATWAREHADVIIDRM